jgi:hypothetical protein
MTGEANVRRTRQAPPVTGLGPLLAQIPAWEAELVRDALDAIASDRCAAPGRPLTEGASDAR